MSRNRKLAMAASILGAGALLGMRQRPMSVTGAPPSAKTPKSTKRNLNKRVVDLGDSSKNLVGKTTKITVDKDALPREIEEKASAKKAKIQKTKKIVQKRKDEGKLSPLMPKSESQFDAMQSKNSGLGIFDMNKGGSVKMIKARGGGMAIQGMKPTKLY
tara:strand:- start:40 stop:516 length:477 start_codon:yes stop_codon:yes gene_type:complete